MNLDAAVQTIGDLPSMPSIASQIMDKVGNPDTSVKELSDIISKDQAFAARVLRTANSSFYGRSRSITRLTDAIMVVGFSTINSIVISAAIRDMFAQFGLMERLLWEHTLGCALAARMIAKKLKVPKIEEGFLAGLLHDVGKVVLAVKQPEKMDVIVQEVYGNPGTTFCEIEQRMLGFNHAQLGQAIAKHWNFAVEIEYVIGKHHDLDAEAILPPLTYIVHLANHICHKLEIGLTKNPEIDLAGLRSSKLLRLGESDVDELVQNVKAVYLADSPIFG